MDSPGSNPPVRTGKMGQNRSPALRVTTLRSDCGQRGPRAPLLYSSPSSLSPPGKPSAVCPRPRWFQRRSGGTTSDPEFPALLEGPRVPAIPQHVMARSGHVFLPMALTTSHSGPGQQRPRLSSPAVTPSSLMIPQIPRGEEELMGERALCPAATVLWICLQGAEQSLCLCEIISSGWVT